MRADRSLMSREIEQARQVDLTHSPLANLLRNCLDYDKLDHHWK